MTNRDELIARLLRNEMRVDQGINELCGSAAAMLQADAKRIAEMEKLLAAILKESKRANDTIALNRDGQGQGRITVAVAMHRIERWSRAALQEPTP